MNKNKPSVEIEEIVLRMVVERGEQIIENPRSFTKCWIDAIIEYLDREYENHIT